MNDELKRKNINRFSNIVNNLCGTKDSYIKVMN